MGVLEKALVDDVNLTAISDGPSALFKYANMFRSATPGFIQIPDEGYQVNNNIISRGGFNRPQAMVEQQAPLNTVKEAQTPFQHTRVQWGAAFSDGVIAKDSVDWWSDNTCDTAKLAQHLQWAFPWTKRNMDEFGPNVYVGGLYTDNTSLYMKGVFYALLQERLIAGNIPHVLPDLHQAPVQYMQVSHDNTRHQIDVTRQYIQNGWFILRESYDWDLPLMIALHVLSLGGSLYPVNQQDQSVAAQSLRWPRIRFLVLTTNAPPPFPAQPVFRPVDMLALLRRLARTHGELEYLDRGWHQASMLIGCEWISRFHDINHLGAEFRRVYGQPVPVEYDPDDPNQWVAANENVPAHPGDHHHLFDDDDGRQAAARADLGLLHIPDPAVAIAAQNQRAELAWQNARAAWVQAGPPNEPRDPANYPVAAPVAAQPPAGVIRNEPGAPVEPPALAAGFPRNAVAPVAPNQPGAAPAIALWRQWAEHRDYRRALTPFYECNAQLTFSAPRDYNPFWRWAGKPREVSSSTATDKSPIRDSAVVPADLMREALFVSGLTFMCSTTVFYSYNLTGWLLQSVSANQFISNFARQFVAEGKFLYRYNPATATGQCGFTFLLRSLFQKLTTSTIPYDVLSCRNWADVGHVANINAHEYLASRWHNVAPQMHNVLAFTRWLTVVPVEWGVSGMGATINCVSEFNMWNQVEAQRGWAPEQGCSTYADRIRADMPYQMVVYGSQIANFFWQYTADGVPFAPMQARTVACGPNNQMILNAPAAMPAGCSAPADGLRLIQPCTVPTYYWETHQVVVPFYGAAVFPPPWINLLAQLNGTVPDVGLQWFPQQTPVIPMYGNAPGNPLLAAIAQLALGQVPAAPGGGAAPPEERQAGNPPEAPPPIAPGEAGNPPAV